MSLFGYHIYSADAPQLASGAAYDYILAGNGVMVHAVNKHLTARVEVAAADIRGLVWSRPYLHLHHGRIPQRLWDLTVSVMMTDPTKEAFAAIIWDGEYRLHYPQQIRGTASVAYTPHPDTVFEIHSHGAMKPFFSGTDDRDEQGMRIYGVIGHLTNKPTVVLRMGVYGYFGSVDWGEVFEGDPGMKIGGSMA